MKLINIEPIEDGAVTLQFNRDEFHAVRDALVEGIECLPDKLVKYRRLVKELDGQSEQEVYEALMEEEFLTEESIDDLQRSIKAMEKLLSQLSKVSEAIETITEDHDLARCL